MLLPLVLLSAAAMAATERLTALVNPFIGTGGHGHTYPGPSLPFGMVQPGPDTRLTGWDGCSGYHHDDHHIYGFSHTHLSGTGIPDYCDVLLAPITGPVRLANGADGQPGYRSAFRHETEQAQPGYYAVSLDDHGVRAELTCTLRAAMHRYTFPAATPAHVILDLEHRDELLEFEIHLDGDRGVSGMRRSRGWADDQPVYFALRFSQAFRAAPPAAGDAVIALGFGDAGGPLLVKVGISAVSIDGARRNLDAEIAGFDFDAVRAAADAAWERELGKVRVTGGTHDQQVVFYTALYHAMLAPNVFMDVDGEYRGRGLRTRHPPPVPRASGFTYYTVFSLWDTFRALHPLLAIIDRARTADFVQTFLAHYREGGRLPVWDLWGSETDCMIGYHAVPVIADAILKGIGGFDANAALEAMKHSAEEDRAGLESYRRDGFVAAGEEGESVSKTLEYGYDDWCIAQVADRLGHAEDAERYRRRAQAYRHLFDPGTGFMRARLSGFWFTPFDPAEVNVHYTEANAWQYSWFVPHDIDGLMRLHGGPEAFARKLDLLFTADSRITGTQQADITGMVGQYAHGNEPSHHLAYLYAFAGEPAKTQALVRRLLDTLYSNRPDGLAGNEDCGQMSAWYVLSALGFYPVTPASNQYVIGSPLFDTASIVLENGKRFTIRARRASHADCYIQSAKLNGRAHTRAVLDHSSLAAGGELELELGSAPSAWATRPEDWPRTSILGPAIVPLPYVAAGEPVFRGATDVALGHVDAHAALHFTLDGTEPDATSPAYAQPLHLTSDTTIKAIAVREGQPPSGVLVARVHRIPDGLTVAVHARAAPQYSAGGETALIDGIRGGKNFRLGGWQGYLGQDFEAIVDLGAVRDIRHLALGCLQDVRAWILMPRAVEFAVSEDGTTYREAGRVPNPVAEREAAATHDFAIALPPTRARYARVRAQCSGQLPAWHQGAGQAAWLFVDEIVVH
ncbi:MAG: GH92 family glycosyl hydrolase [Planctomycetota bacterium]